MWDGFLDEEGWEAKITIQHLVPKFVRHILQETVITSAGVVDDNIDVAPQLHRLSHNSLRRVAVAAAGLNTLGRDSKCAYLHQTLCSCLTSVVVCDQYIGSPLREFEGHSCSDATRSTCHYGDSALQRLMTCCHLVQKESSNVCRGQGC